MNMYGHSQWYIFVLDVHEVKYFYVQVYNIVCPNTFLMQGVDLHLKHVQALGVYGWSGVCEIIIGEWLEDISQNQVCYIC